MPPKTPSHTLRLLPQPDDSSCGPTCLHGVYDYWGDTAPLEEVIGRVPHLQTGGTLGVLLGNDALARGYAVTIHSYNLNVFDPTWFRPGVDLSKMIALRRARSLDERLRGACLAYERFLELGGRIRYEDLTPELLETLVARGPVLAGLSATYLYGSARETAEGVEDSIGGGPVGHFVVLVDAERGHYVTVGDPYTEDRARGSRLYSVPTSRLLGAILLGAVTYDANLISIQPRNGDR